MKKIARSAKTGKFVSKAYAARHKSTTVIEISRRRRKIACGDELPADACAIASASARGNTFG